MSKRREMFLSGNPILKRFTKNSIVNNFNVSEKEFDELIANGFIEENNKDACISCFRPWTHEHEQCMYCGEEEYAKEVGFYSYTQQNKSED